MRLPFIGQSYQHQAKAVSNARTVNWYPEILEEGQTDLMLKGCPGIANFATAGSGPIHGMWFYNGHIWAVSGEEVYRISSAGTATLIGTVQESARASMNNNNGQVFFCNGFNGYVIDPVGSTVTRITDANFYPASICTSLDGYAVFARDGTEQAFNSNNDDASTYGALDFLQVSKRPGFVKGVATDGEYLWVIKELSGQVYYNAANVTGSPFSIQDGASFNIGTKARDTVVADVNGSIYWYGSDNRFYRTNGLRFEPISTQGIEDEINSFSRTDDAFAFSYVERGRVVYVVTFPTAERTFEYRPGTGLWNDRESWGYGYWRGNCASVGWNGEYYVGDSESGKIGKISSTTYTEWGDPLEAYRICQHYEADGAPFWMSTVEFIFEPAVGNTNDPGRDPECILKFSDNDGRSWWGFKTAKLGKKGEYGTRTIFDKLGSAVRRTYRLSVKDPVQRDLVKVVGGDVEVGYR